MKKEALLALENPLLTTKEKMLLVAENQEDRLTIIKKVQKHTFTHIFLNNEDDFFQPKYHYDWWIFPMHVPIQWQWQQRNYDASINYDEAKLLLADMEFRAIYYKSIRGYISALEHHGWNHYPVRYARMLRSLDLFIAVAKEEGSELFYSKLLYQGQRAVDYAAKNQLVSLTPTYELLISGLQNIQQHLATHAEVQFCSSLNRLSVKH